MVQVRAQDQGNGEELVDAGQRGPLARFLVRRERDRGRQLGRRLREPVQRGRRSLLEEVEAGSTDVGEQRGHLVRRRRHLHRLRRQTGREAAEDRLRRPDDQHGGHETREQLPPAAATGPAVRDHRRARQESAEHVAGAVDARQHGGPRGERAAVHEEQQRRRQPVSGERDGEQLERRDRQQEAQHLGDRTGADGLRRREVVHEEEPAARGGGAVDAGPGVPAEDEREQRRDPAVDEAEEGREREQRQQQQEGGRGALAVADAAATAARSAVGQLQPQHQSAGRLVVLAVVQAVQLPADNADADAARAEPGRQEVAEQGAGDARQRSVQQQQQQREREAEPEHGAGRGRGGDEHRGRAGQHRGGDRARREVLQVAGQVLGPRRHEAPDHTVQISVGQSEGV